MVKTLFQMQGPWVQSLVRKLSSDMPHNMAKLKNNNKKKEAIIPTLGKSTPGLRHNKADSLGRNAFLKQKEVWGDGSDPQDDELCPQGHLLCARIITAQRVSEQTLESAFLGLNPVSATWLLCDLE